MTIKQIEKRVQKRLVGVTTGKRSVLANSLLAGKTLLALKKRMPELTLTPTTRRGNMDTSRWGKYMRERFDISCTRSQRFMRIARNYRTVGDIPADARTIQDLLFMMKPGKQGGRKSGGGLLPKDWGSLQRSLVELNRLDPASLEQVRAFARTLLRAAKRRRTAA